jgi:hypothetical protein
VAISSGEGDIAVNVAVNTGSGALILRCFAGPVSLVSFFSLEDLEVRGFDIPSATVLISGTFGMVSSAIFGFFEALLLDCMGLLEHRETSLSAFVWSFYSHFFGCNNIVTYNWK